MITNITQRVNKKLTGFIPINIGLKNGESKNILIKSKALDIEVIKGLHLMAASIDPELSDLLYLNRENLEYWNSHQKELNLTVFLSEKGVKTIPINYGKYINEEREIYLLFQEHLQNDEMYLMDSENLPLLWTNSKIEKVIEAISEIHTLFSFKEAQDNFLEISLFHPWKSMPLYQKMISIANQENDQTIFFDLFKYLDELEQLYNVLELPLTIIHNDFNPRNVALRKNGLVCIYDWELAVKNIPHRDIIEFLCFSLPLDFEEEKFIYYLRFHYKIMNITYPEISWDKWKQGYVYSLKEFLVTRAAFYKVSEILMKLKFGDRIILNGKRMIEVLTNINSN